MIKKAIPSVMNYYVKAKRTDNSVWIMGFLWHGASHAYITPGHFGIGYSTEEGCVSAHAYEIDKNTICKFTGVENFFWSGESWTMQPIWESDVIEHKTPDGTCISEVKVGEYGKNYGVYVEVISSTCEEAIGKTYSILELDEDCIVLGNNKEGLDADEWSIKHEQHL